MVKGIREIVNKDTELELQDSKCDIPVDSPVIIIMAQFGGLMTKL